MSRKVPILASRLVLLCFELSIQLLRSILLDRVAQ
jgi:hypothetical protein